MLELNVRFRLERTAKNDSVRIELADLVWKFFRVSVVITMDCRMYTLPDGRKITKPIRSLVVKAGVPKEEVDAKWADFCKAVSELYFPEIELEAFLGEKGLLGEGVYEADRTCFRRDGSNSVCREFLVRLRRAFVLVLKRTDGEGGGRCLVYLPGGRRIFISNFYFHGIPQDRAIFVEAVRRMLGLKQICWKDEEFPLPIYRNGDGLVISDERSFDPPERLFTCPHCGRKVPESKFFVQVNGNIYRVGCSKECAVGNCAICHEGPAEVQWREMLVCLHCYYGYFFCSACGDLCRVEDGRIIDGRQLCGRCYGRLVFRCEICGTEGLNRGFFIMRDRFHPELGFMCYPCASRR